MITIKKTTILLGLTLFFTTLSFGQNSAAQSDDNARIAISPTIPEKLNKLPEDVKNVLLGKMRQIVSLNGLSATDNSPLFIIFPELTVIGSDVTGTVPPMYTYNMEVIFNIADKYTGNVYATASQAVKGAGKTETAAYNAAFKLINERNGKYKVMLEKAKENIVGYYNTQCELVISRAKSLAAQRDYLNALALLNSTPPVCRECFDKCNEAAAEIGKNMPPPPVATQEAKQAEGSETIYTSGQSVDLGGNIFLRYKFGKTIGEKTYLTFELVNKNDEDKTLKLYQIYNTMLINEKGDEIKISEMQSGMNKNNSVMNITIIPDVNSEVVCEFPKVKEVKFVRFFINENYFKFKNLTINN